jgi:hypothetical protein
MAGQMMSSKVEDSDASAPPNDWWLSDEDQGWLDIIVALEEGRPPDNVVLAKLLRNSRYVVDQRVRDYLADHLEGKIRKARGRPQTTDTIERIQRDFVVRLTLGQVLADLRNIPRAERLGTPSEIALEETVKLLAEKNIRLKESQVRRIVYPRRTSRKPR